MKYVLPLLMFIALGTFSFSAHAANNDDLLNTTLGQAIGQFMSKSQQPHGQAVSHHAVTGRRVFHAKQLPGGKAPVTAATPATPAAPIAPAIPAVTPVNAAATPATPATPSYDRSTYYNNSTSRVAPSLPSIAPAAGTATPASAPAQNPGLK